MQKTRDIADEPIHILLHMLDDNPSLMRFTASQKREIIIDEYNEAKLHGIKLTHSEIAEKADCSASFVAKVLREEKLPSLHPKPSMSKKHSKSKEKTDAKTTEVRVLEFYYAAKSEGSKLSNQQLSRKLHLSYATVHSVLKSHGLLSLFKQSKADLEKKVLDAHDGVFAKGCTMTYAELAKELDLSPDYVSRILRKNNKLPPQLGQKTRRKPQGSDVMDAMKSAYRNENINGAYPSLNEVLKKTREETGHENLIE